MAVYWVGLKPSQNWIRIDIVRHLELIPRIELKDIIAVKKARADENTIKAVTHIAEIDQRPISNTLQRHEEAMASASNAPETQLVSNPSVRKKGARSWLGSIWSGLKSIMGFATPIVSRMGPIGALAGTLMSAVSQPTNQSDSMVGAVRQGLPMSVFRQ